MRTAARLPAPVVLAALAALLASVPAPGAPDAIVVETARYRIEAETAPEEAVEFGRVLEAAFEGLREFFGARPDLAGGERLRVFFGATREGFVARMRADGLTPPESGGMYAPSTRTAYLWRQPTAYYTRCLLIHEAVHQFHYLSRTGNRVLPADWYVEGLAEYLSRHSWDGERLELGVLPLLLLKDFPAEALAAAEAGDPGLADVVAPGKLHRPLSWALLRYFCDGEGGRHRARFLKLMEKLDRGSSSKDLVFRAFGSPAKLARELTGWLRTEQAPWAQIYNEWEGVGRDGFRGSAPPPVVSACRIKAPATSLRATLLAPESGEWMGGLLLSFAGHDDYTTALVRSGKDVAVSRRAGGGWTSLGTFPCPEGRTPGRFRLSAAREGGTVSLHVEDRLVGTFELPGTTLGLALQGSTLRFADVSWE